MSRNSKPPSILPAAYTLHSSQEICSLWSYYGSITRLTVRPGPKTLILKSILPPQTSSADESHLRKLISYRVERYFYTHLSPALSLLPEHKSKVAEVIAVDDASGQILLEDLSIEYPVSCYGSLELDKTLAVIKWLAGFHSAFWAPEIQLGRVQFGQFIDPPLKVGDPEATEGIWRRGGYWYLSTRRDEYDSMIDGGDEEWLVPWVEYADRKSERENKNWMTVLHGDAKGANIIFNSKRDGEKVEAAMYDFQYAGIGTGAQDLVYFFGTTVVGRVVEREPGLDGLLDVYFGELEKGYRARYEGASLAQSGFTREVLKEQWDVALVDWMRFMAGWGRWGNWRWVERCAKEVVARWETEGRGRE